MEKRNNMGMTYPNDLWMVVLPEGDTAWYSADPFLTPGKESHRIDPGEALMQFTGARPTIGNPMMVRMRCALIERCSPFDITVPERIRNGSISKHLEDYEHNYIEFAARRNNDPLFPITGIVSREDGTVIATRMYSLRGDCSDGIEEHSVVVIDGPAGDPVQGTILNVENQNKGPETYISEEKKEDADSEPSAGESTELFPEMS